VLALPFLSAEGLLRRPYTTFIARPSGWPPEVGSSKERLTSTGREHYVANATEGVGIRQLQGPRVCRCRQRTTYEFAELTFSGLGCIAQSRYAMQGQPEQPVLALATAQPEGEGYGAL
jgi:hypothetical protein